MHDEFERAITGETPKRGLSPFGWVLATFAVFALVGTVGAGVIAYKVANEVREGIANVTRELGVAPNIAAARMAARLASADELVSMDPERGLALLSSLDGADRPTELMKAMSAPMRSSDGSVRPDAPDAGPQEGASLRIRSDDGDVSFNLARTHEGGWLTIDSDEGRVRIEFAGGEDDGRVRIVTDERRVEAAFGRDAERIPGWAGGLAGTPGRAQPIVSLSSDRGRVGAVAWEADEDASTLLASFLESLEAEGYEVKVEHRARGGAGVHGSLWARNQADSRMVFMVAHSEDHGRTGVLLGYGEGR
ncbi:MAG TPA: hypothetical protein VMN39_06030 [Longimicrobiaceae bacterium]|nr:hypothetical protein [Longimicrobiaceae bacterium]